MLAETDMITIAQGLEQQGYCYLENPFPPPLVQALEIQAKKHTIYQPAYTGHPAQRPATAHAPLRTDKTCWLDPAQSVDQAYLNSIESLRQTLNQCLFLGLLDYEGHYAHYAPGAYYQQHRDTLRQATTQRIITTILYLNPHWPTTAGGELRLYAEDGITVLETIAPIGGRFVVFLSEHFPHEVLPATQDRYSIAGWFRRRLASVLP